MRYVALPVIWLLFWLGGIVAPPVAILRALVTRDSTPITHAFHAHNRLAATVLGFDGEETISRECGRRLSTCALCRRLCAVLSRVLDRQHCENEAKG